MNPARYPVVNLGQSAPTGAFPVPWGAEEENEERRRAMGVIPAIAFGYPFSDKEDDVPRDYYDVRLVPPRRAMGDAEERFLETPYGAMPAPWGIQDPERPPGVLKWVGQAARIPTRPLMGQPSLYTWNGHIQPVWGAELSREQDPSLGAPSRFEGIPVEEFHERAMAAGIPVRPIGLRRL